MFPWVIIHNIKPNHVDYYHIEGFWDCSMYVRNKYGVKIHTWVETPCIFNIIPTLDFIHIYPIYFHQIFKIFANSLHIIYPIIQILFISSTAKLLFPHFINWISITK